MNIMDTGKAKRLIEQHGGLCGEHPRYTKADWCEEVKNDYTILGYWEWVVHGIVADETESEL